MKTLKKEESVQKKKKVAHFYVNRIAAKRQASVLIQSFIYFIIFLEPVPFC